MNLLFILLGSGLCDNIELATSDFDVLYVGGKTVRSSEVLDGNSVKLYHLGNSIYKLNEIVPRTFVTVDITRYFEASVPSEIRVAIERKVYGLADFVWPFLMSNVVFVLCSWVLISMIIKSLCQRYVVEVVKH